MMPIEDRIRRQGFWAFAAYEVMETTWDRVRQLVESGRPMIYVERWMGNGDLKVVPGLRLEEGGFRPGAEFRKDDGYASFSVVLAPGIQAIGTGAGPSGGSEQDAANRFHSKRDGTRIAVEGFGLGREDHVTIRTWNEHSVGFERSLYLQHEDVDERAEREGASLDGLAALGDWLAKDLTKLAESARHEWKPALDLAAEFPGGAS